MVKKTRTKKSTVVEPRAFHLSKVGDEVFSKKLNRSTKPTPSLINGLKLYQKKIRTAHESPFVFHAPAEGNLFLNYKKEVNIVSELLSKPGVVFVSARSGFGSSSFARALVKKLKKISDAEVVHSDVNYCQTEIEIINTYVLDIADALGKPRPYQTIAYGKYDNENIVQFPQKLADSYGKKIILVLDNFDCILKLPKAKEIINFHYCPTKILKG